MNEPSTPDPAAEQPPGDQGDISRYSGVPAAQGARQRLAAIDDAPLEQHVDVYEDVHRRLQEGLADLDER